MPVSHDTGLGDDRDVRRSDAERFHKLGSGAGDHSVIAILRIPMLKLPKLRISRNGRARNFPA
jgi:hypothetical protein